MFSARDYLVPDDKIINVIGDSHSCFFYGADRCVIHQPTNGIMANPVSCIDRFRVYHVGAALAYNLCESNTTTKGRELILHLLNDVDGGSRILLCFGEIDCRYHIFNAAESHGVPVDKVMEECVERYVAFAREIKVMGYDVMVWGVVASLPDSAERDPEYPRFGTCVERNVLTMQFNQKLQSMLDGESIPFASVFDLLVDSENETRTEWYLQDQKHLSQKMMPDAIEAIERAYNEKHIQVKG